MYICMHAYVPMLSMRNPIKNPNTETIIPMIPYVQPAYSYTYTYTSRKGKGKERKEKEREKMR